MVGWNPRTGFRRTRTALRAGRRVRRRRAAPYRMQYKIRMLGKILRALRLMYRPPIRNRRLNVNIPGGRGYYRALNDFNQQVLRDEL